MLVWGQESALGSGWCLGLLSFSHLLRFVVFPPCPLMWPCPKLLHPATKCHPGAPPEPSSTASSSLVCPASSRLLVRGAEMGGDRVKCGTGLRGRCIWKSLRTAVLRYGFPAGSHFIFYSLSAFQWCTGENEDFYILAGKSHPHEGNTEWPVFLLAIFICLFCSLCSSSEALSHHDAQQFFVAGSGGICCTAGCDGRAPAVCLCVHGLHDKWLFTGPTPVCASTTAGEICGCSSPHGSGLLLMRPLKKKHHI